MNDPRFEKLPKWAQEYIRDLENQRDAAVRALNDFQDRSSPSPIYIEDHPCTGEDAGPSFKRAYLQTHKVFFEYAGVELCVTTWDNEIRLDWNGHGSKETAFIPSSRQQARLVSKENMR